MQLKGKFAVVTGGTAGIGLAISRELLAAGAKVLIVGRNPEKLDALKHNGFGTLQADISEEKERERVLEHLAEHGATLDIFVNNAGTMTGIDLRSESARETFNRELATNLHAPIHLSLAVLSMLLRRPESAIVNVTTGLVYAPAFNSPAYATAKTGLHAFTQSLRWQTKNTSLQVLEVMPPLVDTDLAKDIAGPRIKPEAVGKAVVQALQNGTAELRVGQTKALYLMSRIAPGLATSLINKDGVAGPSKK